jgi:hypothetical protein
LIRISHNNSKPIGDEQKNADIQKAVLFAQENLAPIAPSNSEWLSGLEQTMSLLLFPPNDLGPQLSELMHPNMRRDVAERVNQSILASEGKRRDAAIRNLVKLRAWAENTARDSKKNVGSDLDLGLETGQASASVNDDAMVE